jgi:PEP-CTERM motif
VKRIRSLVALAFVLSAPCAYADSIPILDINITYATASMGPDGGVVFALFGPGTDITGYGGMACFSWCSGPIPDLNAVSAAQVFVGAFLSVNIAGTSYNPDLLSLNCCLFSPSGDLSGSVSGFVGQDVTFRYLNLTLPGGGGWNFNFDYFPPMNGNPAFYQFASGSFTAGTPPAVTPEPGTLGLMTTGVVGLGGAIRRRRLLRR